MFAGLKPYVCSVCDYAGRSRSNLKTHMNRHNTERRHLCDLCGKKFKSKVTLKSHRLTHTDEGLYIPLCPLSIQNDNRNNTFVFSGKPFQCSECDFTSVSKPSLLRHMEQHAEFKVRANTHSQVAYSLNMNVFPFHLKLHAVIMKKKSRFINSSVLFSHITGIFEKYKKQLNLLLQILFLSVPLAIPLCPLPLLL